jgi:mRNA interferase MazF
MGYLHSWANKQKELNMRKPPPPFVSERDVWWTAIGTNVGSEINGKDKDFMRPVLILKKLRADFYIVLPITSKPHYGPWYVKSSLKGRDQFICLHQVQAMDFRRLDSKMGQMSEHQFEKVKEAFSLLFI